MGTLFPFLYPTTFWKLMLYFISHYITFDNFHNELFFRFRLLIQTWINKIMRYYYGLRYTVVYKVFELFTLLPGATLVMLTY